MSARYDGSSSVTGQFWYFSGSHCHDGLAFPTWPHPVTGETGINNLG